MYHVRFTRCIMYNLPVQRIMSYIMYDLPGVSTIQLNNDQCTTNPVKNTTNVTYTLLTEVLTYDRVLLMSHMFQVPTLSNHQLKIGCWNIQGLYRRIGSECASKLDSVEIRSSLCKYDIFCLVETHAKPNDTIEFPDYFTYSIFRPKKKKSRRHSGGLAIFIKTSIKQGIAIHRNGSSEYFWIRLKKDFFNIQNDVFICFTYSPKGSSYSSDEDILDQIQSDLHQKQNGGQCLLLGDLTGIPTPGQTTYPLTIQTTPPLSQSQMTCQQICLLPDVTKTLVPPTLKAKPY